MGYLKRVDDKRYRAQYDTSLKKGERQLKRITFRDVTKKQAEAMLAQIEAEVLTKRKAIENGEQVKDEVILSDLFEGFMKAKRTNKESTTLERYDSLVSLYLKPSFGSMRACALKQFHLTGAYGEWMETGRNGRPVSARTVRHVHELLRNILNWGVRSELLTRNVAALVSDDDLPKVVKPKPLALTDDEVRKLLQEAETPTSRAKKRGYLSSQPWFHPAVAFAVYTGARRGEVLALRWSDVNFEQRAVTIARSITETNGV